MPRNRGVTLLELILALSLSVVIMAAIGMAIDLHLKTLYTRRTNVEESQLARQVLRRIADDLRSAVQYQVIDFSSVEKLAGNSALSGASSALDGAGATDETGLDASLLEGLTGEEEAAEPLSIAASAASPTIPGLYGNQYELQIDVSRLPRVDEYQVMINPLEGETVVDIPSDVKTVAYYLQPDALATATTSTLNDPTTTERVRATGSIGRGLVRRELDRAVSLWAAENNNVDGLAGQGEMLALEVTGLEFRYFDGAEWLLEWDSEQRQGLPVAVAIAIEIDGDPASTADDAPRSLLDPAAAEAEAGTGAAGQTGDSSRLLYRLVVHLPAAEPTSADTARFPETTDAEEGGGATMPSTGTDDSGDAGDDQGEAGNGSGQNQGGQSGGGRGPGGGRGGRGGQAGGGDDNQDSDGRGGRGGGQGGGRGFGGGRRGGGR